MEEIIFDEDVKREREIKKLLIEEDIDYWIGNPVVQLIHGSLILDKHPSDMYSINDSIDNLMN